MGKYKLIAVDLDDTLLNDELNISPRNRYALQKAAELGALITIATGRMYRSAVPFARELGIEVPIVTYQGALVKNALSGDVLVERPVPLELARVVLAEGYKNKVHMNVYFDDTLYVDNISPEGAGYAQRAGVEMVPMGNLLEFVRRDPTKILYIASPDVLDKLLTEMHEAMGDRLYITKSKPNYLEFMHPHATKGHALKALTGKFNISRDQVMAFGDSYNDLDMIRFAGMGIAMGNAPEEIKRQADYITGTNNNDGVAEAIEKFLL